jgi:hypothetical protein
MYIGQKEVGKREVGERDIGETLGTFRLAEHLLIHIHIKGVSGSLIFSRSWHHPALFLRHHKPGILQSSEGMIRRSSWSSVRLRGL